MEAEKDELQKLAAYLDPKVSNEDIRLISPTVDEVVRRI